MDRASHHGKHFTWEETRAFLQTLPQYLRVRPDTGRFWLDAIYLVVIAAVQYSILPHFLGNYLSADLLTPWLITHFVRQPPYRHLFLGLIGGLLWENHSSAPLGTYLCVYWMLAMMIGIVRETFSWHHWVPWLVTFAVAELGVIVFEVTVIFVSRDPGQVDFFYCFAQFLRIGFATAFGAILCRRWILQEPSEAHP